MAVLSAPVITGCAEVKSGGVLLLGSFGFSGGQSGTILLSQEPQLRIVHE